MYKKLINVFSGEEQQCIMKISNKSLIPFDPANKDYQEYLAWLEEGNTPEPADEPETE